MFLLDGWLYCQVKELQSNKNNFLLAKQLQSKTRDTPATGPPVSTLLVVSVLAHFYSQTAKLLSWLHFNIHMLEESTSNRFLSILTASLRSSVPAAPCFLFFIQHYSLILCLSLPCPQKHSAAVRALSIPVSWKVGGARKRKCCMQTIPFYEMEPLCKIASLRLTSEPQKSLFPSTLFTPKQVYASVDRKNCSHI